MENASVKMSLLVCGHIDITFDQYEKYYYNHVQKYLDLGYTFYVGGAFGSDSFVIEQCLGHENAKLNIYHKEFDTDMSDLVADFKNVNYVSGFNSYPERDNALIERLDSNSHVFCALYNTPRSLGSGSFHNVLNFKYGLEFANKFQSIIRNYTNNWEEQFPEVVSIASDYLVIEKK